MNRNNSIQIINQTTKDMLVNRLKRDELTVQLMEKRLKLYNLNILANAEHIRISDVKIAMYKAMNEACELYKKNRRNNVAIELEHKKMTEMKLAIVKKLVVLDNENLNRNFDLKREVEIGKLTDDMNYNAPQNWEENKDRLTAERTRLLDEIKKAEEKVSEFEATGNSHMKKLNEYMSKSAELEDEITMITEKLLVINDKISDDPEHHPVTFIRVSETDGNNPDDVLRNLSQE